MRLDRTVRARLVAAVIALMGLLNVISSVHFVVTDRLRWLRQALPPEITLGSRTLALVAGFALIAVAWNLARRKRVAWFLTAWLLFISALSHLLKGLDAGEALVAMTLLGLLWLCRRDFTVRSDPDAIQGMLFAAPYTVLFFFLYALLGYYLLRHQFRPAFDPGQAMSDAIHLATFQGERIYHPLTRQARWFVESITLMAGVGATYLFYSLMRPVLRAAPVTRRDRQLAAEIVRTYGASDLAYFALGPDKSYFFNDDATCVVAYVLQRGVALALGDPIGAPEDVGPTIRAYVAQCQENHWVPAFYQCREDLLPLYRAAGLEALKVGEEASLDIAGFDLHGNAKQDLRTAVNRARREGWRFRFFDRPLDDPDLMAQLESISAAWLAEKIGGEMGFAMDGAPIAGSDETLVTAATDSAGRVLAFMTWVPMYARRGWAADFMRRAPDAPNGAMEFLIVSTLEALRERGASVLSLSLAPLANVASHEAAAPLERALELIYERFNTGYHFKPLYQFKAKFGPRWEGRYLAYPGLATLPRVVYALVSAQMPSLGLADFARLVRGRGERAAQGA